MGSPLKVVGVLDTGPFDHTRVPMDDLVLDGRREDGVEQPVGLGDSGWAEPAFEQPCAPLTHR